MLVIEQTTGPRPRKLELDGLALPRAPASWGRVSQRASLNWVLRGNEAETSLLGPEAGPASLRFSWRGQDIGGTTDALIDGQPTPSATTLVRALEEMVAQERLVRVAIGDLERVGYLASVDPEVGRAEEWSVELEIQWTRIGAERALVEAAPEPSQLVRDIGSRWDDDVAQVAEPLTAKPAVVQRVEEAIVDMSARITLLATATPGPTTAAALSGILESAGLMEAAFATEPTGELVATEDPLAGVLARQYRARALRAARRTRDVAVLARAHHEMLERDFLGVHVAVAGETIYTVALRWYGDVSGWRAITRANELYQPTLTPGQRVLIPRRRDA